MLRGMMELPVSQVRFHPEAKTYDENEHGAWHVIRPDGDDVGTGFHIVLSSFPASFGASGALHAYARNNYLNVDDLRNHVAVSGGTIVHAGWLSWPWWCRKRNAELPRYEVICGGKSFGIYSAVSPRLALNAMWVLLNFDQPAKIAAPHYATSGLASDMMSAVRQLVVAQSNLSARHINDMSTEMAQISAKLARIEVAIPNARQVSPRHTYSAEFNMASATLLNRGIAPKLGGNTLQLWHRICAELTPPEPIVERTNSGGIRFAWNAENRYIDAEVYDDDTFEWFFKNRQTGEVDGTVDEREPDLPQRFFDLLRQLEC